MDSICSLESPPPALSTCGTAGTINPGSTIQPLSGASVVLFPEQCADLCDAAEGCLSFTVIGGQTGPIPLPLASCILYDVAIEDLQFVEVSLSPTTVYDIGCFSCQSDGVSTTSAADPCTLDLDPIDPESCGTVGLIGSLPDQVGFSARDDATPEVCALLCSETATCIAFAIREGEWCELWANTVEEILFTANPTSSYAAYNLGCFLGCGPLSDTTATVTVSDTGPTGNPSDCTPAENPPSPDDCGIQGVTGLPPDVIDTSYNQADLTPEGCALLCTNTDGCNSFGVGSFAENPYCELWRDEFAELQFAEISGYPFAGYDLACFTCSSVPTSVCPLLDDPPTGSVCGAVGVVEGNVDFLGDAFEPEYLTAEGCAKLCAETEDCQGLALIEDWLCELWGLPASEVSFSSDLNSVIAVYDLDCFECASVDTTSSTTTSSAVSTTATGTPIDCSQLDPENPPPCDELGIVRGSPNVLYTALNSLTPELCAQLCEDTDGCKSFGIGDDGAASFCEIWDLPADELDFVVDEASPFRIWGLECFVCDGGATTTTTTTSATSSLTFTNSSTTSLSSTTPSLSRSSDISSSSSLEVTEPPTSTPSNTASSASDTASSTSVAPSMDAKNLPIIGDKSFLGCLGSTPGFLGFEVVGVDPLMTTIECVGLATDFNYAGVHQDTCYGANSLGDDFLVGDDQCDRLCPGDEDLLCGGDVDTAPSSKFRRAAPNDMLLTVYVGQLGSLPSNSGSANDITAVVTSVVTTVVFTTVCPTDPASLIVTEVCSTIFYEDCGCDSQVVPEVPMTTTLASCHACGPDGGDTVTLIVPAHEIANQFRPSVPAPTGAQNGHFGNDFTGNGPAQAAGYPQGPTGGIGYDGEHIPGVSSGATAGFVQYNAQAQDVANGPESVHGQASGSESHDNAGSVSEHAPTGSSSHGNSHGDAGSVSGHATGSVPQNNPGSVPGGTTGSTSNNVPISHVTGSGATQHRSVTALGWLQVSAILVTSLAFLSFFRA